MTTQTYEGAGTPLNYSEEFEAKHGRELVQDVKGHWRLASFKNYNMGNDEEANFAMVRAAKALSDYVDHVLNGTTHYMPTAAEEE